MSYELTVADKDRLEPLIADNKWHPLTIGGKTRFAIAPGDKFIQVDLYGPKDSGVQVIWLRFQRYPQMDSTAWASFTVAGADDWGVHHEEHFTTKAGETYGVDYRVEVASVGLIVKNRILKGGKDG